MLWYKAWLETRWRFLIGLGLLALAACGVVFGYSRVQALIPLVPTGDGGGEMGRLIREAAELARTYRGYVWGQWFRQNLVQTWTIFAVILGTGGLLSQVSGGGALFTLSLPVTRTRLLAVRAATGLAELAALAVVPSMLLALISPAVGQTYGLWEAFVHSACLFIAGTVFFSFASLLSTIFSDVWRPLLIALCAAFAMALVEQLFRDLAPYGLFRVMAAEAYFRDARVPWLGLLASAATSLLMFYAANRNLARQDF